VSKDPLYLSDMEDVQADQIVEQGRFDVGGELRMARRRKGVDLITAAQELKIREDYLRALEQNDHTALPGLPYAAGFVRSYADYVGLDPADLVRRFQGETEKLQVKPEFTWITPIQEGRYAGSLIFLLSLFLAGAAYAGWYYQTVDERKPAVAADAVTRQDTAPVVAAAAGAAREVPKSARIDRDAARRAGVGDGAIGGDRPNAGGQARPDDKKLDIGKDPMDVSVGENRKVKQAVAAPVETIRLKALGLVWLRVRNPQTQQVVVERIMKKGEILSLPKDPGLVLDVGRASQVEIMVGNRSIGRAGSSLRPRHNLSLNPERLKGGG